LSALLLATLLFAARALAGQSAPALPQQPAADAAGRQLAADAAGRQLATDLATWDWLRRTPAIGAEPSLGVQAGFLKANPDWPGVSAIRRRAEAQAADPTKTADTDARAFFQQLPPQSAQGQARTALLSAGPQAEALARTAWVRAGLSPDLESALLARFGSGLSRTDHARRADALLWAGQTSAAQRLLPLLDDDIRALSQARIALRAGTPDAEARAASVPARHARDPGLTHDRALFLERRGRLADAEALLAAGNTDFGVTAPETWLERRLALGRAAMRRADHQTAYRLLANHRSFPEATNLQALPLAQRVDLSDTEWLAGWIALRKLGRPDAAARHFAQFNRIVTTPISQSRGDYWLGRAEQARGQKEAAATAFARAARHADYYYGQLATEELGRTPELPLVPRITPSAADRRKVEGSSLGRAVA
ncbi:MAG: hypothetical protein ACRC1J_12590, partial [Sandaracinobacteroides sp.]